jgi:CheY-like chemotaxis protein
MEALEILKREQPDLVLLDLMMPEMDGFQFLAKKEKFPEIQSIPVILISARDPLGQPIVSKTLLVTSRDGLSASQLLMCIEALITILSKGSLFAGQAPQEEPSD